VKNAWDLKYELSNEAINTLMKLASLKDEISNIRLAPKIGAKLKHEARLRSTHYSTRIEGNRLSLKQTKDVIDDNRKNLYGRERDVKEVENYWNALVEIEKLADKQAVFSEELIRSIHALVEKGKNSKLTPYRTEQNVIKEAGTGYIVYLPPEAKDVSKLMKELVNWVKWAENSKVPAPVIASLVHYQFVTIHPYYDGNGRTARLLSTFVLMKGNFGLSGMFSLEEYHAKDIEAYYRELSTSQHHNYYEGRETADLTGWVCYFLKLLQDAFNELKETAQTFAPETDKKNLENYKKLDRRAKEILFLFDSSEIITSNDIAKVLKTKPRMAAYLAKDWVSRGFLNAVGESNKKRAYKLAERYK
jgi:Fic family protein